MELSFVVKALQRRWWIIVLFSLIGAIPGSLVGNDDSADFQSEAVLIVSPPSTSGTFTFLAEPDRYVQGQLNVLSSVSLAEDVARVLGDDTVSSVRNNTSFTQVDDTDIVVIESRSPDPERAQQVAQAFAEAYLNLQRESTNASQSGNINALEARLTEIEAELAVVNEAIDDAMLQFLLSGDAVPAVSSVVPAEAARRQLLLDEFGQVQSLANDLRFRGLLEVNTAIVQNASFPTVPLSNSNRLLVVGGYVLGAMLGLVVALVWAQFSPYLIDEVLTSEVTGQPVVGTLSRSRALRQTPLLAAQQARGRTPQTLAQLAVRAEALGSVDRPLVIAVVGPRLGAGATTTSLAMAGRFAQQGSLVTLLDADDRDRTMSQLHPATDNGGLAELVECIENEEDVEADNVLTPTELGGVNVIAQGEEISVLRRANARAVVQTAAQFGDVLIVDGGPLLGSAAVIEAVRHADAIILTVPLTQQLRSQLSDVVTQLGADRAKLLTVVTEPTTVRFWDRFLPEG